MRKFTTLFASMLASAAISCAQTTATNWTAQDCNSNSHTLFNELDNGKIIVMAWIMPCGSCIGGAKAAYNVAQSFAQSHPGKVLYYISDDLGDANCTQMTNWINTNNIGDISKLTVFSNSGNTINENDFGGSGMPHVVVIGGTDHKIYFNELNANANDPTGIQNAIQQAINVSTGINETKSQIKFSVSPNPIKDRLTINYSRAITKVIITTVTGQIIKEETYGTPIPNPSISLQSLATGIYTLKVIDMDGKTGIQKIVKE